MKKTLLKRIASTIIDYIIVGVIFSVLPLIFGKTNSKGEIIMEGKIVWLAPLLGFAYLVLTEYLFSATLGHKIFGLKVNSMYNDKLTMAKVFKRRVSDILDIVFSVGVVAVLFILNTKFHQRIGDLWAKTIVVDKNEEDYSTFLRQEGES